MKSVSALVLCIVLFSCCTDKPPGEVIVKDSTGTDSLAKSPVAEESDTFRIGNVQFGLYPSSKEEFDKYPVVKQDTLEAARIRPDAMAVSRSGDSLIFQLSSGKKAYLVNNDQTDNDDYTSFAYVEDLKSIGYWNISGSYYEAWGSVLIRKQNGDTIFVSGTPLVSPDKKYVLVYSMDLYAGFVLNGFELYELKDGKLINLGTKELSSWGPDEVKWIDANTLLVRQTIMDIDHAGEEETVYKKMLIK